MGKYKKTSRFNKKKIRLPMATKKIDNAQNKQIIKLSKKVSELKKVGELKQLQNYQSSYSGSPTTPITTALTHTSPQLFLLNGSIQGDSVVTRDGDKLRMTSMHVSGQIYPTSGGATLGYNIPVRIVVFISKKPKGVAPTISMAGSASGQSALFYNSGGANYPSTYQQYDTGVNQNMYQNYKILFDKTYRLRTQIGAYVPSTDATSSVNPYFNFNIRKKLGYTSDYSRSNAGTIADIESNALYILFLADTSGNITVEMDSRVYFKDL